MAAFQTPGGGLLYGGGFAGPRQSGVVGITVAPSLIHVLQPLRWWPIVILVSAAGVVNRTMHGIYGFLLWLG